MDKLFLNYRYLDHYSGVPIPFRTYWVENRTSNYRNNTVSQFEKKKRQKKLDKIKGTLEGENKIKSS